MLQTYCIEIEPLSGVHLISFLNFVKCAWAFGTPFFVPPWALPSAHAFKTSYVIQMVVVIILVALISVMAFFLRSGGIPRRNGKPISPRIHIGGT